jgi:hypothetical protein
VRPQLQNGGTSSSAHQPELNPAVPGNQDDAAAVSNGLKAVSTVSNGNGQTAQQQPVAAVDRLQAAPERQQAEQLSVQHPLHADAAQQPESISSGSSNGSLPAVVQKADTGWYYAVGLSAIAALICSVDRAAISVAILPMSEEYGWSDSTKGAINRWAQQELARKDVWYPALDAFSAALFQQHSCTCMISCPKVQGASCFVGRHSIDV